MAVFNRTASTTGVTITTAAPQRTITRNQPTTTGVTISDVLAHASHSASLTVVGLTITDSISRGASIAVPSGGASPEVGLALREGVLIQVNGAPPNSCTSGFRRFLLDLDASTEYGDWCTANPGDCSTWTAYASNILGGGSPSPPSMTTPFGDALVDAGVIALDGIVSCVANKPRGAPHAAFSFAIGGLTVYFSNLSSPGESGLFDSWLWDFGDGTTDTTEWNPAHVYVGAGTYIVTLTVVGSDSDGISSVRHLVTVFVPSTAGIHIDAVIL